MTAYMKTRDHTQYTPKRVGKPGSFPLMFSYISRQISTQCRWMNGTLDNSTKIFL